MTLLSTSQMKLVIGRHSATQQLEEGDAAEPYARVLEMDAALQAEISIIELTHQDSNPKRRPCTPIFSPLVNAEIGRSSLPTQIIALCSS